MLQSSPWLAQFSHVLSRDIDPGDPPAARPGAGVLHARPEPRPGRGGGAAAARATGTAKVAAACVEILVSIRAHMCRLLPLICFQQYCNFFLTFVLDVLPCSLSCNECRCFSLDVSPVICKTGKLFFLLMQMYCLLQLCKMSLLFLRTSRLRRLAGGQSQIAYGYKLNYLV